MSEDTTAALRELAEESRSLTEERDTLRAALERWQAWFDAGSPGQETHAVYQQAHHALSSIEDGRKK